eukprot:1302683-Amphidinium_carterae.1
MGRHEPLLQAYECLSHEDLSVHGRSPWEANSRSNCSALPHTAHIQLPRVALHVACASCIHKLLADEQ